MTPLVITLALGLIVIPHRLYLPLRHHTPPTRKKPAMSPDTAPDNPTETTFTPRDLVPYLGITLKSVYRAVQDGELDHTRNPDGTLTITQEQADAYKNRPRERHVFDVPSTWIAERTGYHRATIYKLRTQAGIARTLDLDRFEAFETAFGWAVIDQIADARAGRWSEEFEKIVTAAYEKDQG